MSQASARKTGLMERLARRTFVVFVSRAKDMRALDRGGSPGWTVPTSVRPGDRVLVYKLGESAGWMGVQKAPFGVFVAAGVVYGKPSKRGFRMYNAPLSEIQMFPSPVPRQIVAEAFPEWTWLKSMRGGLGVEVPVQIDDSFFGLIDRLAFKHLAGAKSH